MSEPKLPDGFYEVPSGVDHVRRFEDDNARFAEFDSTSSEASLDVTWSECDALRAYVEATGGVPRHRTVEELRARLVELGAEKLVVLTSVVVDNVAHLTEGPTEREALAALVAELEKKR